MGVLQEATGGGRKGVVLNRHVPHVQSSPGVPEVRKSQQDAVRVGGTAPHCPRLRPDHCHTLRTWEHPFLLFLSDTKLSLQLTLSPATHLSFKYSMQRGFTGRKDIRAKMKGEQ